MNDSQDTQFRLDGHHALITGGTQGIGAAIAQGVARAGADVTLIGLHEDEMARQTLSRCQALGAECQLIAMDLSQPPADLQAELLRELGKRISTVDLLVNNAGTYIDSPFLEMDADRYDLTMHLNVRAPYFLTQLFAKRWITDNVRGRVLFTGSINGRLAEPDHTAYDASKGAIEAMVRSLCVSLAPHGIRVNAIAPGLIRTPLTSGVIDQSDFHRWMQLHTPDGRIGEPDDCAGAAVFLLSDAANFIHGQTLSVDGGITALQVPDLPA